MIAVALYFVCGVALGRVARGPARVPHVLNLWVINIALPALILAKIPGIRFGADVLVPVAVSWGLVIAGAAAVLLLSRRWGLPAAQTGALLMLVPLGNTSFLGLPVVQALLGQDNLAPALAFDQIGTFLALATYGLWVAGRFGAGERGLLPVVRRLVRFAPFLALVVALGLRAWEVPTALNDAFSAVGRTVAPVAIVSMGMRFVPRRRIAHGRLVAVGLGLKMVLLPAGVLVVALLVGGLSEPAWQSSLVEAAMPPMVTAGVVGVSAGFDEELVTTMVALGTAVCLVTMSVVSLFV